MPARYGTDPLTSRATLRDNRSLLCVSPVAALANASEYLELPSTLAHRIITRDYHRRSTTRINWARKLGAADEPRKVGSGLRL